MAIRTTAISIAEPVNLLENTTQQIQQHQECKNAKPDSKAPSCFYSELAFSKTKVRDTGATAWFHSLYNCWSAVRNSSVSNALEKDVSSLQFIGSWL